MIVCLDHYGVISNMNQPELQQEFKELHDIVVWFA